MSKDTGLDDEKSAVSADPHNPGTSKSSKILGWVTLAGLLMIIVATIEHPAQLGEMKDLLFILLCVGTACFVLAGIPWAHTRGLRKWKIALLGLLGFAVGGAAGVFVGVALDPGGPNTLGISILLIIVGFWIGGILFSGLGVWWGVKFHRRYNTISTVKKEG